MISKQEDLKAHMIEAFSQNIRGLQIPDCAVCMKKCDTLAVDFEPTRGEFLITAKCHGDSSVYHMTPWYANLISERLSQKFYEAGSDQFRWQLPKAFDPLLFSRFEGKLHHDFDRALEAKVKVKQAEDTTPKAELEAKSQFEEEWDHAKAKGQVRTVIAGSEDN